MVNLNDFCDELLLLIFSHLSLVDRLNICDVNRKFRRLAKDDPRFKNDGVVLSLSDHKNARIYSNQLVYRIQGFKLILKYIRIFRYEMKWVALDNNRALRKISMTVFYYVNHFLINLESLRMGYLGYDISQFSVVPFEKVKYLQFIFMKIEGKLCNVSTLFPNVEELGFDTVNTLENIPEIFNYYPRLRKVSFIDTYVKKSQLDKMRILNPHICEFIFYDELAPEND